MDATKAGRIFRAVVARAAAVGVGLATHASGDFVLVYRPGINPHIPSPDVHAAGTAGAARRLIRMLAR